MKTTIASALAFIMAIGFYAYGSAFSSEAITTRTDTPAATNSAECNDIFLRSAPPTVPPAQSDGAIAICRMAYSSFNSPKTKTPIWSAEELTPLSMRQASKIERASTFEEEMEIPASYRSRLEDYRGSGWDRGHLAPSANMPSAEAQQESFSLANIIPQAPALNRGNWADLESDVRSLARRRDAVYVVTGILISGPKASTLPGSRVIIPDHVWKAIISPGEGSVVYLASNGANSTIHTLSLNSFRQSTGIDPFPGATPQEASSMLHLR